VNANKEGNIPTEKLCNFVNHSRLCRAPLRRIYKACLRRQLVSIIAFGRRYPAFSNKQRDHVLCRVMRNQQAKVKVGSQRLKFDFMTLISSQRHRQAWPLALKMINVVWAPQGRCLIMRHGRWNIDWRSGGLYSPCVSFFDWVFSPLCEVSVRTREQNAKSFLLVE
jgi:hypothetical protein